VGVTRFYPSNSIDLSIDLAKPFGFGSERLEQRLSAPSALELCVTASAPPLGAGQSGHDQPRLWCHLTPL